MDPETIAKTDALPLLEVELRLIVPDLVWVPDLVAPAPAAIPEGEVRALLGAAAVGHPAAMQLQSSLLPSYPAPTPAASLCWHGEGLLLQLPCKRPAGCIRAATSHVRVQAALCDECQQHCLQYLTRYTCRAQEGADAPSRAPPLTPSGRVHPPGLATMWAGWVQTLLNASQRVARLDAAEGKALQPVMPHASHRPCGKGTAYPTPLPHSCCLC